MGAKPFVCFQLLGRHLTIPFAGNRPFMNYRARHIQKNKDFVEAVSEANVRLTVRRIRELSPILSDLESAGKIQMAGCIYDVETGPVRFLPQDRR